jgi:hypothetical protein
LVSNGFNLTNLNPMSLASGGVNAVLAFTNPASFFSGSFKGHHSGNGGGLTDVPAGAMDGSLTTNLSVLAPGGGTSMLCFTNGILRAIK